MWCSCVRVLVCPGIPPSSLGHCMYVIVCLARLSLSLASPLRSLTLGVLLGSSPAAFSPFLVIVCTVVWSLSCLAVVGFCAVVVGRCLLVCCFPLVARSLQVVGRPRPGLGCCCCHLLSSWFVSSLPVACCRCRCLSCCWVCVVHCLGLVCLCVSSSSCCC